MNQSDLLRLTVLTLGCGYALSACPAAEPLVVRELTVKLVNQRDVPAAETGMLMQLSVTEGMPVKRGQVVGSLDDRQVRLEEQLANTQLAIAAKRSAGFYNAELANKDLAQQQELAEQQKLLSDIAHRKAGNRVRVLAAEKAEAVAKNELQRATNARSEFIDSVSKSEIDSLKLAYQRMQLEAQQAEFDRQIDGLTAKSEDRETRIQALKIERSQLSLKQASVDGDVAQLQATASQQAAQLAELAVRRHQIVSPIDGIVVQRYRQPGEWVKAGEPIIRVVGLDRLRAEGFVPARLVKQLRGQTAVRLSSPSGDGESVTRRGKVVFISPEVDPVNNEVAFWVEFDNANQDVLPGMRMILTSEL